jgi:hypothetical protein
MWARPLDTCMMDIRFREKFQDAFAVVLSDEERAGLDILTHGDFHCDEDSPGEAGITIRCSVGRVSTAITCSRRKRAAPGWRIVRIRWVSMPS